MRGTGFSMPTHHVWDSTKDEMALFTEDSGSQRNGYIDTEFLVTFSEIEGQERKPAIAVLNAFAVEVERVLLAIEAESRRLGIVK